MHWTVTVKDGTREIYGEDGRLLSSTDPNGQTTSLAYDLSTADGGDDNPDTLDRLTGPFGRTLHFDYDAQGRIHTVHTPDGALTYGYDGDNLVSVTYPDGASRQYHYEDPGLPHHLTGITDENGNRYATWAYDSEGRAVLSEHAGGAERVTFSYNADGTTTVNDALGAQRTYHFDVTGGARKVTRITGDRCADCPAGDRAGVTYDDNGFITSATDWNGNVTTYQRDDLGREIGRTEASGTPEARTVTTEWHPQFNQPVRITEPERVIEMTYDEQGRLLSRSETAKP